MKFVACLLTLVATGALGQTYTGAPRDLSSDGYTLSEARADGSRVWVRNTVSDEPLNPQAEKLAQAASFKVQNRDAGGSATGIDEHVAVTNAHVAEEVKRIVELEHGLTRQKWRGQVVALDKEADLALIWVKEGGLPYVRIDPAGLREGETIVSFGYGPKRILRRGVGRVLGITGRRAGKVGVWNTNLHTQPGDSGSGIFDADGELVGINWGANDFGNAATSASELIELGKYWETQCSGPMCNAFGGQPTGGSRSGHAPGGRPGPMIPVRPPVASDDEPPPAIARPSQPQTPNPTAPPPASIDVAQVASDLAEKLANDPRLKGPKGEQGPRGDEGPPGPPGLAGRDAEIDLNELAAVVAARLPPIYVRNIANGQVIEEEPIHLGEVLNLEHKPLGPPRRN